MPSTPLKPSVLYMGIDPGMGGGIAFIDSRIVFTLSMPDTERDIYSVMSGSTEIRFKPDFAVIEKVHSMPQQGVASTFKFGKNYGFLRGCLIAADIPFDEVTPQTWQKGLGIPPKKKTETGVQWKNRLKAKAQQLFPDVRVTLATADALLIAEYCRRWREGLLNQ